jgi:MFS family permease
MLEKRAPAADVQRNLRLLPFWWVLRWAWLGEAIWVVYLVDVRGLTLGQVLLFEAVYAASSVAAEIPTGMFADRFGRRTSMLAGSLSTSAGFVVFGLAGTLPLLLGSYVLFALGSALMSGADDAFLFDTLRAAGRSEDFARIAGKLNSAMIASMGAFTIAGSVMVVWTPLAWPMVLSGLLSLAGGAIAWGFVEPPRTVGNGTFLATGARAAARLWRAEGIRWIVPLAATPQIAASVVLVMLQPVVLRYDVPLWTLGGFSAAMMLVAATGSWSSGSIARRHGVQRAARVLPILAAVSLFGGASGVILLFPLFVLAPFAWQAMHPIAVDFISRRVPDAERATALSLNQFVAQIGTIVTSLVLGVAIDRAGMGASLGAVAVVLLAIAVGGFALWRRAGDVTTAPATGSPGPEPVSST